ncbi:MAG: tRNA lysidine(34) synthetase TilS [Chloroflexi bacterium]|nr:tRNA lysidine(34) synthetase TilS [Chloroflexota bacterium]
MAVSTSVPPRLTSTHYTRSFEKLVAGVIRDDNLIEPGARVLLAVSGGPDSTALLVALSGLRKNLGIQLIAAYFDHRLRSREEVDADAAYVRKLAHLVGTKAEFGSGDVRSRARRKGESIEEAARAMRYNFLRRKANAMGCSVVAVAHNRNDQAETVLMHIIRGTGLDGIAGMLTRADWPFGRGPALIRPLLDVPRSEIERYCSDRGLEPRRDSTNELLVATRNRIRHELMPILRKFNPRIESALSRLASSVGPDVASLDAIVAVMFRQDSFAIVETRSVRFVKNVIRDLPLACSVGLLKRAFAHLTGSPAGLESVHIQSILKSLGGRRGRTSLPGGLIAQTSTEWITISADQPTPTAALPTKRLRVPGSTLISTWQFEVEELDRIPHHVARNRFEVYVDADSLKRPLTVRSRKPGDRIRPLGLGGSKKVQDILVDAKVPKEERAAVPLLCDRSGVFWVVGNRLDERAAIKKSTHRALRVRASRV